MPSTVGESLGISFLKLSGNPAEASKKMCFRSHHRRCLLYEATSNVVLLAIVDEKFRLLLAWQGYVLHESLPVYRLH